MSEQAVAQYVVSDEFFAVELENFDGPIDLLLHLVKQNELEIEKVSLAHVCSQYLACIERMRDYDLDVASEYLVIAATLLSIKSSVILDDPVELVEDEDGNLIDPHDELLKRLREAEIYKEGAAYLENRDMLGIDVFPTKPTKKQYGVPEETFRDHDAMLLGIAFKRLMQESGAESPQYMITLESVSIVERMMDVIDRLRKSPSKTLPFRALITDRTSRGALIGSFVALLELCKRQVIRVEQENSFGDISILLASEDFDPTGVSSEFDAPTTAEEVEESISEEVAN